MLMPVTMMSKIIKFCVALLFYRFPGTEHHFVLDFICSNVAIKYCETGRAASFIPDILKLNIPEFLVPDHDRGHVTEVSDHFKAFLSSYIAKNRVTKDLMENINHIMVGSLWVDSFQWVLFMI